MALVLGLQVSLAESTKFNIRLIQNDHPSPTLFQCEVVVEKGSVSISGSGYSLPLHELIWARQLTGRELTEIPKFEKHLIKIEDEQFAVNLRAVAKGFDLCRERLLMRSVSGGTMVKVQCAVDSAAPSQEASYINIDPSSWRSNLMDDISRNIQILVVNDVLGKAKANEGTLESIKQKSTKLALNIVQYEQAFAMLEDACEKDAELDWTKVADLVRLRPGQPALDKSTKLVQTAHEVLTASCSRQGLEYMLGENFSGVDAMVIKIGEVRQCRDNSSYLTNPRGFDDVGRSLGFTYLPRDPAVKVGVLDVGLERILLHFLLQDLADGSSAYQKFSLVIAGRNWQVADRWPIGNEKMPASFSRRLQYLSAGSGLLEYLLNGEQVEKAVLLDVEAIVIDDDKQQSARLDYRLGMLEGVLPLFRTEEKWVPNRSWSEKSYRSIGGSIQNRNYFRSRADVEKHNSSPAGDSGKDLDSEHEGGSRRSKTWEELFPR
ncbi:hypothetical protein OKA04_17900 [Luteolibacter flavescens]|uniref:Uncharacterized protein n=1 Tax=Luteolibacter flavescens TaxID=1859460 RepID=A0ABT3FSR1_9BACT|nr:hypothetical protein [Luteolibacter flavescens]MCW1886617.1 hypothetical protein [Luteolibacter flavescens]